MNTQKNLHKKYKPFIISGCSGVGKGTLITNLIENFPELFDLSVSFTTRSPRPGEVHGKHYYFVSKPDFQKLIKEGDFFEYCEVHGNFYGTSATQVQSIINKGKICLLDIDIQGAEKIHKLHPEWNYLFIAPPSLEELELRLRGRGTETEQSIKKRIGNAGKELQRLKQLSFYETLLNDKLQVCYQNFIKLINNKYELLIEIEK